MYENEKVKILVADNNDIIEVFKDKNIQKCKKLILGKEYNFYVYPVSDIIQNGIEVSYEYDLNDSINIKYHSYFAFHKFRNYCIEKIN